MTYKFLISVGLICLVSLSVFSQVRKPNFDTRKNVHIDEKKPTLYLEFVKLGKRTISKPKKRIINNQVYSDETEFETEEVETVWLRVHNNSHWAVKFQVFSEPLSIANSELKYLPNKRIVLTPKNKAELELVYGVEPINAEVPVKAKLTQSLPYIKIYWSITDIWLPSGESVIFLVGREELRRNLQIFLPFKYEWETSEKNRGFGEPEHRLYFDWGTFEKAAGL